MSEGNPPANTPPEGELLLYQAEHGKTCTECRLVEESLRLAQRQIAELHGVSVKTVNEQVVDIHDEGKLSQDATIRKFRIVQTEGKRQVSREVVHHLDAILAVDKRRTNLMTLNKGHGGVEAR